MYRAFTDPDQLAAWFGPPGFSVPRESIENDVRPGGHQRFVMAADDGSMRSRIDTTFVEAVEGELLLGVQQIPEGVPAPGDATTMTLRLEFSDTADGRTRLVLTQTPYAAEWEDLARQGWEGSFTKLDALLTTLPKDMIMDMKLEAVPMPVSDVEKSLAFYRDQAGFHLDHDIQPGNGMRVIQLTPPGSACSIVFGTGMGDGAVPPGSIRNLHLVVTDIAAVRQALLDRGVDVSGIDDMGGVQYAYFADPDGNSWALQQIPSR